jgi:hypothetical protein
MGLVLYGLGLSMIVAPITSAALTTAPERYSGLAAGVNSTSARLGGLLAIAILGVVVALVFAARTNDPELVPFALGEDSPEFLAGSTDAFRAAMVVAATLALAGSLTALGYARLPKVGKAAEAADAGVSPQVRLDPASPDCPAVLVHHEHREPCRCSAGTIRGARPRGSRMTKDVHFSRAGAELLEQTACYVEFRPAGEGYDLRRRLRDRLAGNGPVGGPDEVHLQTGILVGEVDAVVGAARLATLERALERGPRGK